jgi:hypothetical protein
MPAAVSALDSSVLATLILLFGEEQKTCASLKSSVLMLLAGTGIPPALCPEVMVVSLPIGIGPDDAHPKSIKAAPMAIRCFNFPSLRQTGVPSHLLLFQHYTIILAILTNSKEYRPPVQPVPSTEAGPKDPQQTLPDDCHYGRAEQNQDEQ